MNGSAGCRTEYRALSVCSGYPIDNLALRRPGGSTRGSKQEAIEASDAERETGERTLFEMPAQLIGST
jgi:hypothetical protein